TLEVRKRLVAAGQIQRSTGSDGDGGGGEAVVHARRKRERTGVDPRVPGVKLRGGEEQVASRLRERAAAAHDASVRVIARAVELERAVIRDVAHHGTRGAASADA